MPGQTATIRSKWLGADLRRARQAADMSIAQVASRLDWPQSKVSRIENGLVRAHWLDVKALLDLYRVAEDDPQRPALIELAKSARAKGWWHGYADTLDHPFADLISLETIATKINTYQTQPIPGLLQTKEYALAMTAVSRVWESEEDVERFVEVRMTRQNVLTRENPPHLWAVLGESVLRQMIGGPEVMRDQLRHLVQMSRRPKVTVQVLPFAVGPSTGMYGHFVTLEIPGPGALDVVYLENMTGGLYLEQKEEVRRYMLAFDHLRASALSPAKSVELITTVAKEL